MDRGEGPATWAGHYNQSKLKSTQGRKDAALPTKAERDRDAALRREEQDRDNNRTVKVKSRGDSDQTELNKLRSFGKSTAKRIHSRRQLRDQARQSGYSRAEEAYIIEGWVQGRKEAGLSENV